MMRDNRIAGADPCMFEKFFKSDESSRDKFLSRLFGIFSEEVVRAWCKNPKAPYKDLGRPTLRAPAEKRGHTLDFTLRHNSSGMTCVAEMKCELEYEGYRYLRLHDSSQVQRHKGGPAFQEFLQTAKDPGAFPVKVGGSGIRVDGAILVWGAITSSGRDAAIADYGFNDVLSVEEMVQDLGTWQPDHWIEYIGRLQYWSEELFGFLTSP